MFNFTLKQWVIETKGSSEVISKADTWTYNKQHTTIQRPFSKVQGRKNTCDQTFMYETIYIHIFNTTIIILSYSITFYKVLLQYIKIPRYNCNHATVQKLNKFNYKINNYYQTRTKYETTYFYQHTAFYIFCSILLYAIIEPN